MKPVMEVVVARYATTRRADMRYGHKPQITYQTLLQQRQESDTIADLRQPLKHGPHTRIGGDFLQPPVQRLEARCTGEQHIPGVKDS